MNAQQRNQMYPAQSYNNKIYAEQRGKMMPKSMATSAQNGK